MVTAVLSDWTPTAKDLPILGEPLAIEFANTQYGRGEGAFDFLGSSALVMLWLTHAAPRLPPPTPLHGAELEALLTLRTATHALISQAVDGLPLSTAAIGVVNTCAELAPRVLRLQQLARQPSATGAAGIRVETISLSEGWNGLLGQLAHEVIELLGGNRASLLRRCESPDCTMLFLRHHHRRRWCHDSCGHRSRQAAYSQRKLQNLKGNR